MKKNNQPNPLTLTIETLSKIVQAPTLEGVPIGSQLAKGQLRDPETSSIAPSLAATVATEGTIAGTLFRADEINDEFQTIDKHQFVRELGRISKQSSSKIEGFEARYYKFFSVIKEEEGRKSIPFSIAVADIYRFYLTRKLIEKLQDKGFDDLIKTCKNTLEKSISDQEKIPLNLKREEQDKIWLKILVDKLFYNDPEDCPLFHFRYLGSLEEQSKEIIFSKISEADQKMQEESMLIDSLTAPSEIDKQAQYLINFMAENTNEKQLQAFARKYQLIYHYLEQRRTENPETRFRDLQRELKKEQEQTTSLSSELVQQRKGRTIIIPKPQDPSSSSDQKANSEQTTSKTKVIEVSKKEKERKESGPKTLNKLINKTKPVDKVQQKTSAKELMEQRKKLEAEQRKIEKKQREQEKELKQKQEEERRKKQEAQKAQKAEREAQEKAEQDSRNKIVKEEKETREMISKDSEFIKFNQNIKKLKEERQDIIKTESETRKELISESKEKLKELKNEEKIHREILTPKAKASEKDYKELYKASKQGNKEKVSNLIEEKAFDLDKANNDGTTALYIASKNGYKEIVELLLKNNADPNKISKDRLEDQGEPAENTPFFAAIYNNNKDITKLLIDYRADINFRTKDYGLTALNLAVEIYGNKLGDRTSNEILELLLANRADTNLADKYGSTPLRYAVQYYCSRQRVYKKVIEILIKNGANPNYPDFHGSSPILLAKSKGANEILPLLELANKPKTEVSISSAETLGNNLEGKVRY